MIQDGHEGRIEIPVSAEVGDTVVVAGIAEAWIYVHEIIGDLAAAGNFIVKAGSTTLASFILDEGQGITLQSNTGGNNVPRFKIRPGEDFILTVSGGAFTGACVYSLRY